MVAHFAEMARAGLPVIAYNNPFSTRVDLTPPLLARLAGIGQVQAVKEFSQDSRSPRCRSARWPGWPGRSAGSRHHRMGR